MANPIGWCTETINVNVGCTKCSPGCAHCYAETMAVRLAGMGQEKYQAVTRVSQEVFEKTNKKYPGWNGSTYFDESALRKPFTWKNQRTIFVNSMGDTFHEGNSFADINRVMAVICENPKHKFMILTKRPERMAEYFEQQTLKIDRPGVSKLFFFRALENLALGVTAENQEMADRRIPILLQIPAAVRFVSIEPMLGPVDISKYLDGTICMGKKGFDESPVMRPGLDWVIAGGENGPGARTFPGMAEAIVNIKDQCQEAGVPFFYKGPNNIFMFDDEWDSNTTEGKEFTPTIEGVEYRQRPAGW